MSKDIVIRKFDNNNFCLAERLAEPKLVVIGGVEVEIRYDNIHKFYGRLHDAICGLYRHSNKQVPGNIPEEFKEIKPNTVEKLYCLNKTIKELNI